MRTFQASRQKRSFRSRKQYASRKRTKRVGTSVYRRRGRRVGFRTSAGLYNPVTTDYAGGRRPSRRVVRKAKRFTRAVINVEKRSMPKHYIVGVDQKVGVSQLSRKYSGITYTSVPGTQAVLPGTGSDNQFFTLSTVDNMVAIMENLFSVTTANPTGTGGTPFQYNQERVYVDSARLTVNLSWKAPAGYKSSGFDDNVLVNQNGVYVEIYHCRARKATSLMTSGVLINGFGYLQDPSTGLVTTGAVTTGFKDLISTVDMSTYGVDLFKNKTLTSMWKILSKKRVYLQAGETQFATASSGITAPFGANTAQGSYSFEIKGKPFSFTASDLLNAQSLAYKTEAVFLVYYGDVLGDTIYGNGSGGTLYPPGAVGPAALCFNVRKEYTIRSAMPALAEVMINGNTNYASQLGAILPMGYTSSAIVMNA